MLTLSEAANIRLMQCPFCQKGLTEFSSIAIATRHCPSCGHRVFAEPSSPATYPFSREQLNSACAASRRSTSRGAWLVFAGVLWIFGSVLLLAFFEETIKKNVVSKETHGWVFLLLPFMLFMLAAMCVWDRATKKSLRCTHCGHGCSINTHSRSLNATQLTGNCGSCGQPLTEPPPEGDAGPFPSGVDFQLAQPKQPMFLGWYLLFFFWLAIFVAVLGWVGRDRFWHWLEERYGVIEASYYGSGFMALFLLILFAIGISPVFWFPRHQHRQMQAHPALHCSFCKADLLPKEVVVASRRCPSCARRVLQDA
jgi:DNA-directed RNA polymerase subunit RPC12/RpoP